MSWYRRQGRHDLPWRRTRDPYAVLVAEVMLQQTQVERVLPYYERWLQRWPTLEDLAQASPAEVIREWAGLGYNRRALNLQRAASAILERHRGRVPREIDSLRGLPGVGTYTAGAIASFAFGRRVAVVDTNIGRVLARAVAGVASHRAVPASRITAIAESLLPARDVRHHNLALMDLGATVCAARAPKCGACPLSTDCAWRLAGSPAEVRETALVEAFEETARFARGRIVEMLRRQPQLSSSIIAAGLSGAHVDRVDRYLEGLERDGLVERSDGSWRLPLGVRAG